MASIYSTPLIKHVVRFRITRIGRTVGVNVCPDIGEKVRSIAGLADIGAYSRKLATVFQEDLAVTGKVVLFEGRRGEDGFRVEQAGKLRDQSFALFKDVLNLCFRLLLFFRRPL